MKKTVERRLEFLKLEAQGLSLCEIVKELSVKYRKTERTIYYDAEIRETWQPLFTQLFNWWLDQARLVVVNRYEYIYREAAFILLKGQSNEKMAALKIMLDVTKDLVELLGLDSLKTADFIMIIQHCLFDVK